VNAALRARPGQAGPASQRGIATLVVVMVLFFVVAMVAAYTSRNLIFEQRTSANQFRSSIAFEAADAGVEWTLAMLNGSLIDDNCEASAATPGSNFQQRYLSIATDGTISLTAGRAPTAPANWPSCAFDGTRWGSAGNCRCPRDATLLAPPPSTLPAFRAWLPKFPEATDPAVGPGMVSIQINGCTRMSDGTTPDCLAQDPQAQTGDAVAGVRVVLALRPGFSAMPVAAVTAQGVLTMPAGASSLRVVNTDSRSNGITVNTGGTIMNPGSIQAEGVTGGATGEQTMAGDDTRLRDLSPAAAGSMGVGERMFVSQFGMRRALYREQPGLRTCPGFGLPNCTAASLTTLLATNPQRIIWVDGDLTLDASLGSATAPVLLIVNGSRLSLDAGVKITGFVYITGAGTGTSTLELPADAATGIQGALVAESALTVSYSGATPAAPNLPTISYDPVVLNLLRTSYGSWVRLPGGWRDFKD
jgi:hypothetical protein